VSGDHISPIDYRYFRPDDPSAQDIRNILTEDAYIRYILRVEVALAWAISDAGLCSPAAASEIEAAARGISSADVDAQEKSTSHSVKAIVDVLRSRVSRHHSPYVHLFATSSDVADTANALRLRDVCSQVLIPNLVQLARTLADIAERHAGTVQIGRTHGMFAEPITFGFTIASHLDRLTSRIVRLTEATRQLRGQLSGAVGSYNAMTIANLQDATIIETRMLDRLGLPSPNDRICTQIVQPEPVTDLAYFATSCFSVIANLADDMRNLHRSEIAEVHDASADDRVGSSTMPHKRNPIAFENVKSLWKAMVPRIVTLSLDQISDHQRDLTNSASSRFTAELFAVLDYATRRTTDAMKSLNVDAARMKTNLATAEREFLSEPLYIGLALAGSAEAHVSARRLVELAIEQDRPLEEVVQEYLEAEPLPAKLPLAVTRLFSDPQTYRGLSSDLAAATARKCRSELDEIWELARPVSPYGSP